MAPESSLWLLERVTRPVIIKFVNKSSGSMDSLEVSLFIFEIPKQKTISKKRRQEN